MSLRQLPAIYLAGPDVFIGEVNRRAIISEKRAILHHLGLEGLDPMDNELPSPDDMPPEAKAMAIYRANIRLLDRCDGALVNLTPFRGPSADAGTVFEVGYLAALGKPISGYTLDAGDYRQRVHQPGDHGVDDFGRTVEQFGLMDNLMIESAIVDAGGRVLRGEGQGVDHGELYNADLFARAARELKRLITD